MAGNHSVGRSLATSVAWSVALGLGFGFGVANGTVLPDQHDVHGPLDLGRVSVTQSVKGITLEVPLVRRFDRSKLDPTPPVHGSKANYVCLSMRPKGSGRVYRVCLGARPARVGVQKIGGGGQLHGQRVISARSRNAPATVLRWEFSPKRAHLPAGRYRIHATSSWAGNECSQPCLDAAPNRKTIGFRVRPLRLAGCDDSGIGAAYNGPTSPRRIALTFDDGPSDYTQSVISILDHYNAAGTFFEVGQEIAGREAVMREALRHGDELGDHSMHHAALPSRSDIAQTARLIKNATGFRPCLFRPPYGATNSSEVATARSVGMSSILWNVDPADWSRPGTDTIYQRVITNARSGSIVIMHDGGGDRSETVAALPRILAYLEAHGYRLVTVSKLLGQPMRYRLG